MPEREISGDSGGLVRIDCKHCGGIGKCGCYDCYSSIMRVGKEQEVPSISTYNYTMKENPILKIRCAFCNGFGFILMDSNGGIIVPKLKEEQ